MNEKISFSDALLVFEKVNRIFYAVEHPKNITPREMRFLFIINQSKLTDMREIKNIFKKIAPASRKTLDILFAKIVRRLVANNYLEKTKNKNDRRSLIVTITPKGQEIIREFKKSLKSKWDKSA